MELYHYRSIDTALLEISEGTFRFASRDELNDPIEGYLNLYFSGDKPAWEGLFKNYICSLYNCLSFFLGGIEEDKIFENVIASDIHHFEEAPIFKIYQNIIDEFLKNRIVQTCIEVLMNEVSDEKGRCSKEVLTLWLTLMQFTAYNICAKAHNRLEGINLPIIEEWGDDHFFSIVEAIRKMSDDADDLKKASEIMIDGIDELLMIGRINRFLKENEIGEKVERKNLWLEISSNFSYYYVAQLENLVYSDGWVVCFSKKNDNTVMWGNYADHHRGVCLIYDFEIKDDATTELKYERGRHNIYVSAGEVKYTTKTVERNFFETLGRFNQRTIRSFLEGRNGEVSKYFSCYQNEGWRDEYRKIYNKKYYIKMPAWKYEEEYRLLLEAGWFGNDERYFEYPQTALKGVIFGKETSSEAYVKILKAIKKSSVDLNAFNVYRAVYDETERKIIVKESKGLARFLRVNKELY